MKYSLPLGRVFGIRIGVHATFALLLFWVAWLGWERAGPQGGVWAVVLTLALFLCVVLHELGHSVVAQFFGVQVQSITLLPIGGVAAMTKIPDRPIHELLIALAGPAVNVVIVALLLGLRVPLFTEDLSLFPSDVPSLLQRLLWANVLLVAFNMLPAFPMDGGRVLRSGLAIVLPYARATRIAAGLGQVMAFGFLLLGLLGNPLLVLIAVFVFLGARGEVRMIELQALFHGVTAEAIMRTDFEAAEPHEPLESCLARAAAARQRGLPVLQDGRTVGVLDGEALSPGATRRSVDQTAGEAMRTSFIAFAPETSMERAWLDVLAARDRLVPVVSEGVLRGIVTAYEVQAALAARQGRPEPPPLPAAGPRAGSGGWRIDLG